jgi:asparagine synthase (glutamine-hydrolysing)
MCGIAGIAHWGKRNNLSDIEQMSAAIAHRGPDGKGILHLPEISLAHRRLSIIDLSNNASQPMQNKSGRFVAIFNGEIYNYTEIKNELKKKGYAFKNNSDTEVVLNAYEEWGTECLKKFNGMFAITIWDTQKKQLFIARDRFGKKPLYYYFSSDKQISFASELTALIKDKTIERKPSIEALNCYLALGYILAPLSFYENVFKLEAATYLLISDNGSKIEKKQYWNYADYFSIKTADTEKQATEKIIYLLEDAVKLRMISDVPVGAFLSGGVDSSAVVSLMKKNQKGDLHTFSIGFAEKTYNELAAADAMAKALNTHHHGEVISGNPNQLIADAIAAFDEPFADNSLIPMLYVSQLAKKHVTVALSGDGADELFAGYITYKAGKYYYQSQLIPHFIRKIVLQSLQKNETHSNQKINFKYKLKQFLHGSLQDAETAHYSWRLFFHPEERVKILGEHHRQLIYDTDPCLTFKKHFARVPHLHWLDKNLYVDAMTWLTDDILVKVDRTSMRSGLEARAPFLDYRLAEYVASLPPNYKLRGGQTKYILKKALQKILPHETLYKKKSGFNAPVGKWLGVNYGDEFRSFNKFVFDSKNK